ncbi:MAG: hypothetical protein Q8K36_00455 [Alphaproteobacteria bacterium]|nr:hypothetical protein [Alphaproteobacteria bacterium]
MTKKINRKVTNVFSPAYKYRGSIFWLVVWTILFFPLAVFLLLKNVYKITPEGQQYFEYQGRWGWIYFWAILFFPIAILLLFFNGLSLVQEEIVSTNVIDEQSTPASDPVALNRPRNNDEHI